MVTDNPSAPAGAPNGEASVPPMVIGHQYVKDLSFEVPNGPGIFDVARNQSPQVTVGLDVLVSRLPQNGFEVGLKVNIEAKIADQVAFVLELVYCGLFSINVPNEHMEPVLLIECPRMLFPFARTIVCDITRDGGFPPLMLQPVDFVSLYRQQLAQRQAAAAQPAAKS